MNELKPVEGLPKPNRHARRAASAIFRAAKKKPLAVKRALAERAAWEAHTARNGRVKL